MGLYENVREAAKEKGITISALEEELEFTRGSVYKWSKHCPSVDKLRAVSKKLDKPIEYFLE